MDETEAMEDRVIAAVNLPAYIPQDQQRKVTQAEHRATIRCMLLRCMDMVDKYDRPTDSTEKQDRFFELFLFKYPTKKYWRNKGEYYDDGTYFNVKTLKACLKDQLMSHNASGKLFPTMSSTMNYFFKERGQCLTPKHQRRCMQDMWEFEQKRRTGKHDASNDSCPGSPSVCFPAVEEDDFSTAGNQQQDAAPEAVVPVLRHQPVEKERETAAQPGFRMQLGDILNDSNDFETFNTPAPPNYYVRSTSAMTQPEHFGQPTIQDTVSHNAAPGSSAPAIEIDRRTIEHKMDSIEHNFGEIASLLGSARNFKARLSIVASPPLQELYQVVFGQHWHQVALTGSGLMATNAVVLTALVGAAIHRFVFQSDSTPERGTFAGFASSLHTEYAAKLLRERGFDLHDLLSLAEFDAINDDRYRLETVIPYAIKLTRQVGTTLLEHLQHQPVFNQSVNIRFPGMARLQEVLVQSFEQALMIKSYIHAVKADVEYVWFAPGTAFDDRAMKLSIAAADDTGEQMEIGFTTLSGLRLLGPYEGKGRWVQKVAVVQNADGPQGED